MEDEVVSLGPEKGTSIERLIEFFRFPFLLGCVILSSVFGPPGAILLLYVQSSSWEEAFSRTVFLFLGDVLYGWQGFFALGLFSVIFFYFLYMIRFMRLKLLAAKTDLIPILPEGEETFNKVFSPVCSLLPQLVVGTVLVVLAQLQTYPSIPSNYTIYAGKNPANLVYVYLWLLFWLLIVGTFIWIYIRSIYSLYKLGARPLRLLPYHLDRTLGTRPIGKLSLSLTSIYLIGIGLSVLMVIIVLPQTDFPFFTLLIGSLMAIGVAVFFLPLFSVHRRMVEAKNNEMTKVRQEISRVLEKETDSSKKDLSESLDRLTKIIAVDVTKGELADIPTWPVDAPIMGRLITLLFSIIGILIANYLMRYLLKWG